MIRLLALGRAPSHTRTLYVNPTYKEDYHRAISTLESTDNELDPMADDPDPIANDPDPIPQTPIDTKTKQMRACPLCADYNLPEPGQPAQRLYRPGTTRHLHTQCTETTIAGIRNLSMDTIEDTLTKFEILRREAPIPIKVNIPATIGTHLRHVAQTSQPNHPNPSIVTTPAALFNAINRQEENETCLLPPNHPYRYAQDNTPLLGAVGL